MITIKPTRTCFDDIVPYVKQHGNRRIYICHGLIRPLNNIDIEWAGETIAHAWIYDPKIGKWIDWGIVDGEKVEVHHSRIEFLQRKRPLRVTYYTPFQFVHMNWIYGFIGPFEEEYRRCLRTPYEEKKPTREFSASAFYKAAKRLKLYRE